MSNLKLAIFLYWKNVWNREISQPNQVGRIGGEEFLAILYKDNESLKEFASDLIKKIQKNIVKFEDTDIKITASGGVAFAEESESSSDLVNKADKRLYKAKKKTSISLKSCLYQCQKKSEA